MKYCMDSFEMAQKRAQRRVLVNTVMYIRVRNSRNFLISRAAAKLSTPCS
jgi:hypothetical protein